jgi:uncharacterized membrane protein YbhN (UPF0104 family)
VTIEDRLLAKLSTLGAKLRAVRGPLLIAGAALFLLGLWWSFGQLRLSVADIRPGYFALLLLLMPVSLLYSGIGLQIIAWSGGVRMPLGQATGIACHAALAEALPIPGGAIVRSSALVAGGVRLVKSVALVAANAILWIAISALGAGFAILPYSITGALALIALGGAGIFGITGWLMWKAGIRVAAVSLVHRLAGVLLLALRLFLAFQAIGIALPFVKSFPVTLATIAGSAASVTPAGLGVSEGLAALIANVMQVLPAAAFLAVGMDRLLFIVTSGIGVLAAHAGVALRNEIKTSDQE